MYWQNTWWSGVVRLSSRLCLPSIFKYDRYWVASLANTASQALHQTWHLLCFINIYCSFFHPYSIQKAIHKKRPVSLQSAIFFKPWAGIPVFLIDTLLIHFASIWCFRLVNDRFLKTRFEALKEFFWLPNVHWAFEFGWHRFFQRRSLQGFIYGSKYPQFDPVTLGHIKSAVFIF